MAACCICLNSTNWFHANISSLQAMHSARPILAVIEIILGEEMPTSTINNTNTLCFECVDKINDYDEAYEKMQIIEREFKLLTQKSIVKLECDVDPIDVSAIATSTTDANVDGLNIDDIKSDSSNDAEPMESQECQQPPSTNVPSQTNDSKESCEEAKLNDEAMQFDTISNASDNLETLQKWENFKKSEFNCDECGKSCLSKCGLTLHLKRKHPDSEQNKSKESISKQKCSVTPTPLSPDFACHFCKKKFMLPHNYKKHMRDKHHVKRQPPFECDYCGIKLIDDKMVNEHNEYHSSSPNFQCLICKRVLSTAAKLREHTKTHTGEKSYACTECDKRFTQKQNRDWHVRDHFKPNSSKDKKSIEIQCHRCGKVCRSKLGLLTHLKFAHKSEILPCDYCGIELNDQKMVNEHKEHHLSSPNYLCIKCKYIGKTKKHLKEHAARAHTNRNQCKICDRRFSNATSLKEHITEQHNERNDECRMEVERRFECDYCGIEFVDCEILIKHKKLHSDRPDFQCIECDLRMRTSRHLKKHMQTHNTEKPSNFECLECGKQFASWHGRNKHLSLHVEPKLNRSGKPELTCDHCGKHFVDISRLEGHINSFHKNAERPECFICQKSFPNKDFLEKHTAICTSADDTTCHICKKIFTFASACQKHMMEKHSTEMQPPFDCDCCGIELVDQKMVNEHKEHHSSSPYFQCLECNYIGKRKNYLRLHMRQIHLKEKKHLCDICGKAFSIPSGLENHLKYHYNDLNAECYLCKHRRRPISALREHMRIHTGEKPFGCTKCNKRFARKCNRDTHLRLHFGPSEKKHKCTMCDAAFARTGKLSKHYFESHGLQIQPTSNRLTKVKR